MAFVAEGGDAGAFQAPVRMSGTEALPTVKTMSDGL